jgi:glyoxylase-like metal-dependent hydrolase (beta-lactamase superfamily II)
VSRLTLDVFNTGYTPVNGGPGWDPTTPATWPACTASLISADTDAVLVDALMTFKQGHELSTWIQAKDKNVSTVVITHGHGDHFFGAATILAAFPDAGLVAASTQVIEEARGQTDPNILENWTAWFGDEYDHDPPIPTLMEDTTIEVGGHAIAVLPVGGADGVLATVVHLPDLDTVCAGDAVYNDIHMWLWNSTQETRANWLTTIDAIAAMQPAIIIAGHRDPAAPDDDSRRLLAQSRRYVEDFDLAMTRARTAGELIDAMMAQYRHFGNPYTLFLAAHSQFPQ